MAAASFCQTSFLGGEWGVYSQGRTDHPRYKIAMNVCLNAFPIEEGACPRRPGTEFAAATRLGAAGITIPFVFAQDSPYVLEFTDAHMRVFRGTALLKGTAYSVTALSAAVPAVATVASALTWANGDQVQFNATSAAGTSALATILNRQFAISAGSFGGPSTFAITDAVTGVPFEAGSITVSDLTVSRIYDAATPWTSGDWSTLRSVQGELETLLLQATTFPQILTADPTQADAAIFSLTDADILDGPYLDPTKLALGYTLTPSGTTGSVNLTVSNILAIGNGGFQSSDIGRLVRIFSQPAVWAVGTAYVTGNPVMYPTVEDLPYIALANSTGVTPDAHPTSWAISPSSQTWSWAEITAITSTTVAVATIRGPALKFTTAASIFRMGAYSDTTGYPTCGTFHEGRVWLGGVVKNRFDACVSNGFKDGQIDFAPTNAAGTVLDSSAISYTLNAESSNPIFWFKSNLQGIVVGTLAGEYLIRATAQDNPLTPTSIQAKQVTKYGCANIEPVDTGLTTVLVQRFGRRLIEYLSDVFSGKFFGPNLSEFAKHLTTTGVEQIAYQAELTPVIWGRTGAGALIGTTYRRVSHFSSEPPIFNGWHRHELGSGRVVESLCVSPSTDGLLDVLTLITNDPSTGVRHVEMMTSLPDENAILTDAWFLDDAVVPVCGATSGSGIRFFGLNHMEGRYVDVFAAGLDCGTFLVSSGFVTVPFGSAAGAFTLRWLTELSASGTDFLYPVNIDSGVLRVPCVIGFSYTTQGQLLRPGTKEETGAINGPPFGKTRRAHQFSALLHNAVAMDFGTDFDHMRPGIFTTPGNTAKLQTEPFSGIYQDVLDDDYSFDSQICWQVTRPVPGTVVSLGGFLKTEDR